MPETMACEEYQDRIYFLQRGELEPAGAAAVRSHVEGCARCREAYEAEETLTAALAGATRYAAPPGYASEATLRSRVVSQVLQAAVRSSGGAAHGPPPFEEIVSKGYEIVGSPDEVAEQLREVALSLNVGQLMLLLQFGNMSRDLTLYNTELFAKKVKPQLAGLFEREWENRWWPRPLPDAQRALPRELAR